MQEQFITGIVVHSLSKQPVPNQDVMVKVYMTFITQGSSDPEFPNGRPFTETYNFNTKSNADGRFSVQARFPEGNWSFSATAGSTEYVTLFGVSRFYPVDPGSAVNYLDTIQVEKPAYITYSINTMGIPFENETLKLRTPYTRLRNTPSPIFDPSAYNLYFYGKVNTILRDTIPGERQADLQVEWLRFQFDTIEYRKETLRVQPYQTTNYSIKY